MQKIIKEKEILEKQRDYKIKYEMEVFDRSKHLDADYIECKEELGFIKRRLYEIRGILNRAKILSPQDKSPRQTVHVGADVTLKEKPEGNLINIKIVESVEINPSEGKISPNSPLGKALLNRREKEDVFVGRPVNKHYTIESIGRYTA